MISQINVSNVYNTPALMKTPKMDPVFVDNFRARMESNTDAIDLANNKKAMSFEQTVLQAFDNMNSKQVHMDDLSKQMIVDPESVDVHDVTIGMAEANLSLKLAQTVIDRLVKSWNDITTNR